MDGNQHNEFDFKLTQVNAWIAELHTSLKDGTHWPNLSEMDVTGNYSDFVDIPVNVLAGKLNWLLRSREEALQNIMKW